MRSSEHFEVEVLKTQSRTVMITDHARVKLRIRLRL